MRIGGEDRRLVWGEEGDVGWADGGHQGEGKWRQGSGWLGNMTLEQEWVDGKLQEGGSLLEDLLAATYQRGRDEETQWDHDDWEFQVHGKSVPCQGGVRHSRDGTQTLEYEGQVPAGVRAHDDQRYRLEGSSCPGILVEDSGAGTGGLAAESHHRSAPGRWEVFANCLIKHSTCAGQSDLLSREDHQQD